MRLSVPMSLSAKLIKKFVDALLPMAGLKTFFRRRMGSHWWPLKVLEVKRIRQWRDMRLVKSLTKLDSKIRGGTMGAMAAPSFVSRSARSLPSMPECEGQ